MQLKNNKIYPYFIPFQSELEVVKYFFLCMIIRENFSSEVNTVNEIE